MVPIRNLIRLGGWLAAGLLQPVLAGPVAFTVDSSQSFIFMAPPSGLAGFAATPQGPGALVTSYSGSLNVDLSGTTIQFPGGSAMVAQTNGVWQPAVGGTSGSAPADYGPQASVVITPFPPTTAYGALRNISFDVTSPALPLTGTNFNGTNLVFSFASVNAAMDYNSTLKAGSLALGGYATNAVAGGTTLSTNGGLRTLFLPISAQFLFTILSANDTKLYLSGQIVATNALTVPAPVIESISVTQQIVVVAADNVTGTSQLLVSTNLTAWSPAAANLATNNLGWILFTTPVNGSREFFRVQQ